MRHGDFSNFRNANGQMIPIYDPLTTDAAGNRTAFPGNIIPANRINPSGQALRRTRFRCRRSIPSMTTAR